MEGVDFLLASRQDTFQHLSKKLKRAQDQMKKVAEGHHMDMVFAIGDWVYVKLHPYRQSSLFGITYQKLGKWYYGPYQIMESIGLVAYKLALPESTKIHHVFHCSLLKPYHGPVHFEHPFLQQL